MIIQPAQQDVVYAPQYDPATAYGAPVQAPAGYTGTEVLATGLLAFGTGMALGALFNEDDDDWDCGWSDGAAAVRFTTTTMFTYPIRRSHHAATATILQDLRLPTVRVESAGRVESVERVESAGRAASAERVESAGRVESAVLVESVAREVSADPGESVDQGELAGVLWRRTIYSAIQPSHGEEVRGK